MQISTQPPAASVNTNSSQILNLGNDSFINPRSFHTANDSTIQTFTTNGNAANPVETPDFSPGFALI